ncbi:hypothetical protein EVAR_46228_1 [Eumeta japonica]|uniref:Uncharacterized protein n=1 Tax=Eumeta variegata TaxID=151549 RepID=A0A4C1XPG1_EUMVA|nr:hypothetical protein EVAR_46228_1 [Eumeta japonica]
MRASERHASLPLGHGSSRPQQLGPRAPRARRAGSPPHRCGEPAAFLSRHRMKSFITMLFPILSSKSTPSLSQSQALFRRSFRPRSCSRFQSITFSNPNHITNK